MGFDRIWKIWMMIWKNNVQEAYLPKMSFSGQIVSEIVAQLCLENSIQTLLIFFGSTHMTPLPSKNLSNESNKAL